MGVSESNQAASPASELVVWEVEVPKVSGWGGVGGEGGGLGGVAPVTPVPPPGSGGPAHREAGPLRELPEADLGGQDLHLHAALHPGLPDLPHGG